MPTEQQIAASGRNAIRPAYLMEEIAVTRLEPARIRSLEKMQNQSQFVENLDTPPAPQPPAAPLTPSPLPEKMQNQTQSVENFNIWGAARATPPTTL